MQIEKERLYMLVLSVKTYLVSGAPYIAAQGFASQIKINNGATLASAAIGTREKRVYI